MTRSEREEISRALDELYDHCYQAARDLSLLKSDRDAMNAKANRLCQLGDIVDALPTEG